VGRRRQSSVPGEHREALSAFLTYEVDNEQMPLDMSGLEEDEAAALSDDPTVHDG
jgi:hypothetical protein